MTDFTVKMWSMVLLLCLPPASASIKQISLWTLLTKIFSKTLFILFDKDISLLFSNFSLSALSSFVNIY